jgi:lipoprotein-anchoring transpeptidase ErfK/SrfK
MRSAFRSVFAAWAAVAIASSAGAVRAQEPGLSEQSDELAAVEVARPPEAVEVATPPKAVEVARPAEAVEVATPPEQAAAVENQEKPPQPRFDVSKYEAGTIVVETSERKLHLMLGNGEMLTYPVGVGKAGKSWSGTGFIRGKFIAPAWSPPRAVRREKPYLPDYIPGGTAQNPMGAAAMTLNVDQYAIHGTNVPSSIGGFVSFGCIRMHNRDILDLYKRVKVGTRVVVLQ